MAVHKKGLLDFVQYLVFQVLRALTLEQVETERVDCADEHLGHPGKFPKRFASAGKDSFFELGRRLICERKGNDVPGQQAVRASWCKKMDDASSYNFSLPRA